MAKNYVGDAGTVLLVDVKSDISRAKKLLLRIKKPSGRRVDWVGTLSGKTKIRYVIRKGDWNEVGVYQLQAYVEMPAWSGHGEVTSFTITNLFK